MNRSLEAVGEALGLELTSDQMGKMQALGRWLRSEGIPSGGLGPGEAAQIEERHLADSLTFAAGWPEAPPVCLDLGSGLGLPGLVLAVVWPETAVTLVDRSEKRCDLARRGARVTGIDVRVVRRDFFAWEDPTPAVVSRAAAPASRLRPVLERILAPGGTAVVSGDGSPVPGFTNLTILDRPTRLLIMRRS